MTSELIKFNHLRCHSSSTALGTRTGYSERYRWNPSMRQRSVTKQQKIVFTPTIWIWRVISSNLLSLIKISGLYCWIKFDFFWFMVFNSAKKGQEGGGSCGISACWGAMNYRSWQNSSSTNVWGDLVEERSFYFLPSRDWSLVIETGLLYQTLLLPTDYGLVIAISKIVLRRKWYLGYLG